MARLSHIALSIAVNVLVLMCIFAQEERYSDEIDHFDYHIFFKNNTIRDAYYDCYMEIGPCQTDIMTYITGIFSEVYQSNCKKCTEKQKEMFLAVTDWFRKNEPNKWQLVVAKTIKDMKKKATQ
ncbi:PREDICTED: ejaculatory bulb-specific protein 3-like [Cyphomyrmex costatus]|nr:PREDICTED: ejaculatory bulb-specific protein 3-like [Cyphomyrmex costatus]